jgi:hypothetical protein
MLLGLGDSSEDGFAQRWLYGSDDMAFLLGEESVVVHDSTVKEYSLQAG